MDIYFCMDDMERIENRYKFDINECVRIMANEGNKNGRIKQIDLFFKLILNFI
jgi:hypothetical protein